MNFWNTRKVFQILSSCNVLIEKRKMKPLSNIKLLYELPFYDELSVKEISEAFKRYGRNYKVEIIDSKDPLVQLEARIQALKICLKNF